MVEVNRQVLADGSNLTLRQQHEGSSAGNGPWQVMRPCKKLFLFCLATDAFFEGHSGDLKIRPSTPAPPKNQK